MLGSTTLGVRVGSLPQEPSVALPTGLREDWRLTLADVARCSGYPLAIDVETNGVNWWQPVIHTIGVGIYCPKADVAGYFPTWEPGELEAIVQVMLDTWDENTWVIAHNLKFEWHFLGLDPRTLPWQFLDTMLMAHLVDSRARKGLAECERMYLGDATKKQHVAAAPKKTKIWNWPEPIRARYCINDCIVTYDLAGILRERILEMDQWSIVGSDIEYLEILWHTERRGHKIDVPFLEDALIKLQEHLDLLVEELHDSVGYEFNWRSHKQLSQALYEGMGIERLENPFDDDKSRVGFQKLYNATQTSTFILMEKRKHPLGELISFMRETDKLRQTVKKWLALRDQDDIIHPTFKPWGTRTYRLSCSNPNMQNIASEFRTRFTQSVYSGSKSREEEYNLRNGFIARPGMILVATDWQQMEMRMFGILSQDPNMLPALMAGEDNHLMIAKAIWGDLPDFEQSWKTYREWAKTMSFGLIYGMTTGSLMYRLNLTWGEAQEISGHYWRAFPRVQPWLNEIIASCESVGYVRYWSGRVWREDDPVHMYKGANAAIQGGCADILKVCVLRFYPWLMKHYPEAGIVNYIHDEFIAEVPVAGLQDTVTRMQQDMNPEDLFDVPWFVDTKVGYSYGSLIPIEEWVNVHSW